MTTPIDDVRTKERAKASNEVFTPTEAITQMLDDIAQHRPALFTNPNKTILEPSCGNGRFLTAILERRLDGMCSKGKFFPSLALRGLYGIDIHASNVVETREAMLETLKEYSKRCRPGYWCSRSRKRMEKILQKNIVCGDSAKILGNAEYYDHYDFEIDQPDPFAFNMEDEIKNRPDILDFG